MSNTMSFTEYSTRLCAGEFDRPTPERVEVLVRDGGSARFVWTVQPVTADGWYDLDNGMKALCVRSAYGVSVKDIRR